MNVRMFVSVLCAMCLVSVVHAEPLTYSKDIAPIFNAKCVSCHRPGEIAPFSMMDYDAIRPWAKSIRKAVHERSMPPWHADSSKTEFLNDRSLSNEEIEKVVAWVDQGVPRGNPADLPPAPEFNDTWSMGEPDYIFHAETDFEVPAYDQEIPYQPVWFETDLQEDLYITSWELRPTERATVHHANLSHVPRRVENIDFGTAIMAGGAYIGSYLPGARPIEFPEGTAFMIPKGSQLGINVHYTGIDKPVTDHLMFGVKYAQGRIDHVIRVIGAGAGSIDIAPHEAGYVKHAEATLLRPMRILSSGIHMHLRGSAYTSSVTLPDGTSRLIADVPNYDFNWQTNYELANPVSVPKGSKYHVRAVWDNSESNPNVPDPSLRIKSGPWTDDEMMVPWSHVVLTDEKLGLEIEDGRVVRVHPDAIGSPKTAFLQTVPIDVTAAHMDQQSD